GPGLLAGLHRRAAQLERRLVRPPDRDRMPDFDRLGRAGLAAAAAARARVGAADPRLGAAGRPRRRAPADARAPGACQPRPRALPGRLLASPRWPETARSSTPPRRSST